jgi:hypothetical protein
MATQLQLVSGRERRPGEVSHLSDFGRFQAHLSPAKAGFLFLSRRTSGRRPGLKVLRPASGAYVIIGGPVPHPRSAKDAELPPRRIFDRWGFHEKALDVKANVVAWRRPLRGPLRDSPHPISFPVPFLVVGGGSG